MTPLEARLAGLAVAGQTITYGALARDLGLRLGELTSALEELMARDAAAGLPLRAALCEGRLNNGQPALGFFLTAAQLGFDASDPAACVTHQRNQLFGKAE